MKAAFLTGCILVTIIISSCQKSTNISTIKTHFADSALDYLRSQLSNEDFDKLDLSTCFTFIYHQEAIGMQLHEKGSQIDTFIVVYKESGNLIAARVSITGLRSKSQQYNGSVTIHSLDKTSGKTFTFKNNKIIEIEDLNLVSNSAGGLILRPAKADKIEKVLPEILIISYVDPDASDAGEYFSLYWIFNQNYEAAGYYSTGVGSGISNTVHAPTENSHSPDNVTVAPRIFSPNKPISDVKKELMCFTNNNSSHYTISVNINQPAPNSRKVFDPFSDYPVGHTFLTLRQQNSDGSVIIRNVGFYPKNNVKPGSEIDQSTFGDDSNTPYDVSLQIEVSGSDYFKVLNSLIMQQSKDYDLNNFNCTNSSIDALSSINVNLPSTKSNDLLFDGNSPADLGEDIRNLNLTDFSAQNGDRKITRSESNSNDKKAPSREGGC